MGRKSERTILLIAALAASLLIASCGGSSDGAPAGGDPTPIESSPELVIRAISGGKGQAEEGLFALEPLLRGDDRPGEAGRLEADGFSGGDAQFPFVYTQRTVVFRCSSGACALNVAEKQASVAEIGEAWCLAPSATPGRVWLAELDPDEPPRASRIGSVREVDVSGGEVHAEIDLPVPNLFCPVGSFDGGLLFQDEEGLLAIDVSGDIQRIPDHFPLAGHGTLVVSYGDRPREFLRITDLEGGEERRLPAPRGWSFASSYEGDISPDGSNAAALVQRDGVESADRDTFVAIVDLEAGTATVRGPASGSLSFSDDGQWLYAVGGPGGDGRRGYASEITSYEVDGPAPYVRTTAVDILHLQAQG